MEKTCSKYFYFMLDKCQVMALWQYRHMLQNAVLLFYVLLVPAEGTVDIFTDPF
jgi:hypothetical protein